MQPTWSRPLPDAHNNGENDRPEVTGIKVQSALGATTVQQPLVHTHHNNGYWLSTEVQGRLRYP